MSQRYISNFKLMNKRETRLGVVVPHHQNKCVDCVISVYTIPNHARYIIGESLQILHSLEREGEKEGLGLSKFVLGGREVRRGGGK